MKERGTGSGSYMQVEGLSKCKLITWQLPNYKYFFLKTKKRPFLYSQTSTEMVIFNESFQTLSLSKCWRIWQNVICILTHPPLFLRYDFWYLIGDIILITDIVNSAPPSITVVVSLLYKPIIMTSADITISKMFCVLLPVNAFKMSCVLLFVHPQIQKTINIRVKADSM